ARRQRNVTNGLGGKAETSPSRNELVIGIDPKLLRADCRTLTIRRRRHDQTVHRLHTPVAVHELDSKPMQQFGMRRLFALRTEVLARFDQAASEILLPDAVDSNPCRQRI